MADEFPVILKELDELCNSSKYVRVFSDPVPFVDMMETSFSTFDEEEEYSEHNIDKADIECGLAHSLLQNLIGEDSESKDLGKGETVSCKVSAPLLTNCLQRVREVEADHSLVHMIERFSGEENSLAIDKVSDILRKGESAPGHEALSLMLLAVKVSLCQPADEQTVEVEGLDKVLKGLCEHKVLQPQQVIKMVRQGVNEIKAKLLTSPLSFTSVAGSSPSISDGEVCSVLAHGELGVVALTDAFDSAPQTSFTMRVQCSGAFQVGWAHCGLEFNDNTDLRKLDGCCVFDGESVYCNRIETCSESPCRWEEDDVICCTINREEGYFIFSRNDCDIQVEIPDSGVKWRPVFNLVKDVKALTEKGMYPSVYESLFCPTIYVEQLPARTWTWGKGSKGVQASNGIASTSSQSPSIVLGNSVLATGVHQWTMIATGDLNDVKIGAASEDILHCLEKVGSCREVYLWTYGPDTSQFTQSGKRKKRESIPTFKAGDKIQLEIDIDKRRMTFAMNNTVVKVAHDIRLGGWVPIAYFTSSTKLELSSQKHEPKEEMSRSQWRRLREGSKRSYSVMSRFRLTPVLERSIALTSNEGYEVTHSGDISNGSNFTLSLWVRLDAEQAQSSHWLSFLLKGNDHTSSRMPGLFVRSKDMILALCVTTAEDWNTAIRSTQPLEVNKWTHIGVTYHNKTCCLYIDGTLNNSLELSTPPIFNTESWYMGKCPKGVKKPCANYAGVSGRLASVYYGSKTLESSDMKFLSSCPPTAGVDFILEGMSKPTTRLRLGREGVVTIQSRKLPECFTLEALIIPKTLSEKYNCFMSQGDASVGGFEFGMTNLGALYFNAYKKDLFQGKNGYVRPGKLHHISVVFGNEEILFFVDGFAAGSTCFPHELVETPFSPLFIGNPKKGFNGDLLDVRVWHDAKSQDQVKAGMSRDAPKGHERTVVRGRVPKCNKDHRLSIFSAESSDCQQCGKCCQGECWHCSHCSEYTCFKCCADNRIPTCVKPAHWFRFSEGIGALIYDTSLATSKINGKISGTFQWMSSPIEEETSQSAVEKTQDAPAITSFHVKEIPRVVLGTLADVAKSFEEADSLERKGFGVGVVVKPPRQAVFPFVTTFNLLYSLIGQLHSEGNGAALVHALELLSSNLYAMKSAHFLDQPKTGLGPMKEGSSFSGRLLMRIREVAASPPIDVQDLVSKSCAQCIGVGLTTFYPSNKERRGCISMLISENSESSKVQVEFVCRIICADMSLVEGLLITEDGELEEASPLGLLKGLLGYIRKGNSGAVSKLLLLLQQVLVGIITKCNSKEKPHAPMLSLLNSLTEKTLSKPLDSELQHSNMRIAFGDSAVKVDRGMVTHEGASGTWGSRTTQDCLIPNTGKHSFYFRVAGNCEGPLSIGIAGDEFSNDKMLGSCDQSVGWNLFTSEVHCLGKATRVNLKAPQQGHLLSLSIDSSSPPSVTLRNEETSEEVCVKEMGKALERLFAFGPTYAAVSLSQPGQSVAILRRNLNKPPPSIRKEAIKQMEPNQKLLLPYCQELFQVAMENLKHLESENIDLEVRPPVLVLVKSMCASLFLSLSLLKSINLKELQLSDLLRSAESLRASLASSKQFKNLEELEELVVTLALLGVEEACKLIECEVTTLERVDKLLEAGFKEGELENEEVVSFMNHLLQGNGIAMDMRACVVDHLGSRPFQQLAAQGEEIAQVMRMLNTCMLYHAGGLPMALQTAQNVKAIKSEGGDVLEKMGELKLSKLLIKVFEAEKAMRMWCRQQKTGKKIDYPTQAMILEVKLKFLLELMPRLGEEHFEGEEAQLAVVEQVARFVKSEEDIEELRSSMNQAMEKARQREQGLLAAKELLRFDGLLPCARAAVMSRFKLFRTKGGAVHYLDEFQAGGLGTKASVKSAFDALFMKMGKELENAVESGDMDLQLVVLNAWGLRLKPEDHSLLSHARLFDTLHLILQQQEDEVLFTVAGIQRLKLLKKAALKLVVLLATQVANTRK